MKKNTTFNRSKNTKITKKVDVKTTGHEWDGIEEFANPDPDWLRVLFYVCLFFAFTYWILYPSWPTPNDQGILLWSSDKELKGDIETIEKTRYKYQEKFDKLSFNEIFSDTEMLQFAMHGGKSAFHNSCAMCHGIGGGGNPGYPNLTAGAWLWGGSIDDIYTTLKYGIRSGHPEARDSQMPSFGKDGTLNKDEINLLVYYVLDRAGMLIEENINGKKAIIKQLFVENNTDNNNVKNGQSQTINIQYNKDKAVDIFNNHCASCHGIDGKGNLDVGAPNLVDAVFLYGSDYETIYDVIYNGRGGVMPYWSGKLSDSTIRQLSVYVHQLGGGT